MQRIKYGLWWDESVDDAQIERSMIRNGGRWKEKGREWGDGLFEHFKRYWTLLWPEDDQHRWTDSILREILAHRFTFIIGPPSSWKTGTIARIAMMDWSVFPECTGVLVSSTDMKGLERRVYGEMKSLWRRAYERYEWFPGNVIDHKHIIASESIEDDLVRDIRNGIIGIPCKSDSGVFLGMGSYSGFKNRRVWCIGDEFQFMEMAMLKAQDNLIANGPNLVPGIVREGPETGRPLRGYKAVFIGNPNPTRPENPLHVIAEPIGGWSSIADDGKTHIWDCQYMSGRCINLDGADSPNNDFPKINGKPRWVHLSNQDQLDEMERTHGKDSEEYWTNGRGVVRLGLASDKVIPIELCRQFNAFDVPRFDGEKPTVKIGFCDAAYGGIGGDRCPAGWLEFGMCVDGIERIFLHPMRFFTARVTDRTTAEDQVAQFIKNEMTAAGVDASNFFFDGRGSLSTALTRVWAPGTTAVEFGGKPTNREVGPDIYKIDDEGNRRPKLASEHYVNFVSELWFSTRYAIESDQVRGMYMDLALDGAPRKFEKVKDNKYLIETKRDMKLRTRKSPDLMDAFVVGIEGARRRGFKIKKLASVATENNQNVLQELSKEMEQLEQERELTVIF